MKIYFHGATGDVTGSAYHVKTKHASVLVDCGLSGRQRHRRRHRSLRRDSCPTLSSILNAGSSSLKFSVFITEEPPQPLLRGQLEGLLTQPRFVPRDATAVLGEKEWPSGTQLGHRGAIEFLFTWGRSGVLGGRRIVAVGHRVVHGGMRFTRPSLMDAETLAELEALVPLAPLHQPHNLAAIKAVMQMAPTLPQIACFDTAFHRAQPSGSAGLRLAASLC